MEKVINTDKHKYKAPCPCSGNSIVRSEGELLLIVVRQSFNIPTALPYCLWGTLYLQGNNWATSLQPYLPAGVTCVTNTDNASVNFIYTDSLGNSDVISVFTPPQLQISYPELLANLNTNYLRSELVYFNCNTGPDPTPVLTSDQMQTIKAGALYQQKTGALGGKNTENIIPYTRNLPNQSEPKITEISLKHQEIKPDTVWVHQFEYVLLGGQVGFLVFYWNFIINARINMNEEKIKFAEAQKG